MSQTLSLPPSCSNGVTSQWTEFRKPCPYNSGCRTIRVRFACAGPRECARDVDVDWRVKTRWFPWNFARRFPLPVGSLPEEVLAQGNAPEPPGPVGPSFVTVVQLGLLDNGQLSHCGMQASVLVVDLAESVLEHVRLPGEFEALTYAFDPDQPFAVPMPEELDARIKEWIVAAGLTTDTGYQSLAIDGLPLDDADLTGFHSTQEPTPPKASPARRRSQATVPGREPPTSGGKRPTVANLSQQLEPLMALNQSLVSQVKTLSDRQQQMEVQFRNPDNALALPVPSALRQPLSASLPPKTDKATLAEVTRQVGNPPKVHAAASPGLLRSASFQPPELVELEEMRIQQPQSSSGDLAKAVLAQSQALTALVSQIATSSGDLMMELNSSGTNTGTRGAAGRAKLQADLASQKGIFFQAVLAAMARRMQPTIPSEGSRRNSWVEASVAPDIWSALEALGSTERLAAYSIKWWPSWTFFRFRT